MIRVLSRADASRALTRGFETYAADLCLSACGADELADGQDDDADAGDAESLLAAVGNDGKLFVWALSSLDGTLE
jgi:hypothetical protein